MASYGPPLRLWRWRKRRPITVDPELIERSALINYDPKKEPNTSKTNKKIPYVGYATRMGVDQVDLYVGPNKQQFTASKKLLCDSIPYFDKMFLGEFREAQTNCAYFPEDSPAAFELLIEWTYTKYCTQYKIGHPLSMDAAYAEAFCLAEKLCLPLLEDHCMTSLRAMYNLSSQYPTSEVINIAYAKSHSGSYLRRFVAQSIHFAMKYHNDKKADHLYASEKLSEMMGRLPELLQDVIVLMRATEKKQLDKGLPLTVTLARRLPVCEFHHHPTDEVCTYR